MKESGGEWLLTVTAVSLQLVLHVNRQGTPTLVMDPLGRGVDQFGYTCCVMEMRRELSSVSTVAGGSHVLPVMTWVSDAEVSVHGVRRTRTVSRCHIYN